MLHKITRTGSYKKTTTQNTGASFALSGKSSLASSQLIGHQSRELHLSDNEELALAKGLNYSISHKSIPKEGIIAEVESSIRSLPSVIADQIRFKTAKRLISAKPPRSTLTHEETKALKNLRSDPDSIILPADKGNATVILGKTQYTSKITELLTDGTYIPHNDTVQFQK
ncbi:hypothetical protein Trydic_g18887 [Trypoxylus dichotomus]